MTKPTPWLNRFALLLAGATLCLIFVGGLVTSTDSGLSVPDWPLSYGRLMPPMVGGILFEHGHRLVAATVGLLTVLMACFFVWKEDRSWVKKFAWAAVGLVILQGVLGGLTVLLRLPKSISIAHACLAQTFFCVVTAIAVWTSRFWRSEPLPRTEPEQTVPLHRIAMALFVTTYIQLILGAILRHTGWAFPLHIGGAVMVVVLTVWCSRRVWRDHYDRQGLVTLSTSLVAMVFFQVVLGLAAFGLKMHRFDVIPAPFWTLVLITLHVAVGALVLGGSLTLALVSYRTKPTHTAPLKTTLSDYFTLTKPGISFTAGITAVAGFVLGSHGHVDLIRLANTCFGVLLAAASAGILNMLIEIDVDAQMKRTAKRPLPSGRLQPGEALFLGTLFWAVGVIYLAWTVNVLTAVLAAITVSVYLYVYTPLKKISAVCVNVGAVAGALPPVMGWTAATGRLGIEALVLFGILFFWQFPHFLSLAWLYKDDYASAGLHMLPPSTVGTPHPDTTTAWRITLNSIALLVVSCVPTFLGLTGRLYFSTALLMGVGITVLSVLFMRDRTRPKALRLFLFSILYIPLLVAFMVLNKTALL
jgi:protoheme IX farnesyltransferase